MDTLVKIGASLIQHGPENNRVYLMKLAAADSPGIIAALEELAGNHGYTKIFGKIPASYAKLFEFAGYVVEAKVPGLFQGEQCGLFVAKYLDEARREPSPWRQLTELEKLINKAGPVRGNRLAPQFRLGKMSTADVFEMADLYRKVFQSYPFPIDQPEYLRTMLEANVEYFGIREGKRLVALAAAEKDPDGSNVEMTDFAVLPEYRGQQLALSLLQRMEVAMRGQGLITAYTIARLNSPGMNLTFHKSGYRYGGTLLNNTQICGGLESMNVWYKSLWTTG